MKTCFVIGIVVVSFVVHVEAQIGTTNCASNAECAAFANSVCDTVTSGTCVCATAQGYTVNSDSSGCIYNCGDPPGITDGTNNYFGTVTGSQAFYSCNAGFMLTGNSPITCVTATGWETAPTCIAGKLGDVCFGNIELCDNIANGQCTGFDCACLAGYEDDGTTYACVEINECLTSPCQNGGTCSDEINAYSCACATGYEGTNCQTNPDDCALAPCINGGTCTDGLATYTCACAAGYQGTTCDVNIDECEGNLCQNGATCIDGVNGYTCTCVAGYDGTFCGNNIDECLTNLCANGAACVDEINQYSCTCVAGYEGTLCTTNIDECIGVTCQNGGTCVDGVNMFTCTCVVGYDGTFCENNIDECATHLCANGASCIDGINAYTCNCVAGYDDEFCTTNIDDCTPSPCVNGGTCTDLINDFSCACVAGYEDKTCQTNINECSPSPCQNGATCTDGINDYACTCVAGYNGKDCDQDIDDCAANDCENGATCVDQVNYYDCTCVAGYDGTLCTNDIDECQGSLCTNGATCVDQVNGYGCVCVNGYDGIYCDNNIDECATHTCMNGATCVDGVDTYTCQCVQGWDGTFCTNDIDECATHSCQNGATCVDEINGYSCICVTGYSGQFCSTNDDDCAADPCMNGATCTDGVNTYTCACVAGYAGNDCENNIDECNPDPCQNGATCSDGINQYTCACVAGYAGTICDTNIDECTPPPCQNGGSCTDIVNDYYCTCLDGYDGKDCDNNIDECANNLCQNGATCVDLVFEYQCVCVAGYDGIYCQNDIDECSPNSCQNGATCVDNVNGFTCTCVDGYDGTLCEINIDECASNPCQNGGSCTDLVNAFMCTCTDGFTGETCRAGLLGDDCSVRSEVCANINNAQCDGSTCVCSTGFEKTGPAVCDAVDCGTITPPDNGAVDQSDGTVYLSLSVFTCNSGYDRNGLASVTCLDDTTWDGATPTCVIKDCGTIAAPTDGFVTFTPNTEFQGKAEFSCKTGYILNGLTSRTCESSGVWGDSSPVCTINDCGTLTNPTNGNVDLTDGTTYSSVSVFTCNAGYSLVGESQITCGVSSWNATKPVCQIKDCGFLDTPLNGALDDSQGTEYGAVATFSCNIGYDLVGDSTRTCQSSGVWSKTNPICQIKDCGIISNPSNGDVDITAGTTYQDIAVYTCDAGYDLNGITQRTCQSDGQWSSVAPTCDKISCGTLKDPTNGEVDLTEGILFEAVAYFSCNPGYTLTGVASRDCQADETWSAASPTCVIKDCGGLTSPEFGQVLTVDGTTFGETGEYSCNLGYQVNGVSSRVCEEDGAWSASDPTCVILDCGPVANLTNGLVTYSTGTLFGATAYYVCSDGFEVTGVASRVCTATGDWSDSQPSCTILDCDEAIVISNGVSQTPSGSQVGDLAIYECNTGYGLVGNAEVPCDPSGYWGTVPECRLDCGTPPTVNNSVVVYPDGTLVAATATYTCSDGYSVSGDSVIACETSGNWANDPFCNIIFADYNGECSVTAQCVTVGATCRDDTNAVDRCLCAISGQFYDSSIDHCLADCGSLPDPTNGEIDHPAITATGQIAVYSCFTGYALNNPSTRTCQSDGQWSGVAPLCVSGCPYPSAPDNGNVDVSEGLAAGDIIRYSCNVGFALTGEAERICLTDSQWNGNEPTCVVECPVLQSIEHGSVDLSQGNWAGSKATYICTNNYALVGISTRSCESSGLWSGVEPECVFAIFPDVLLVFGSLFVFLVIIDIFILAFCVYIRYGQKPPEKGFDNIEKKKGAPDVLDEEEEAGVPPDEFMQPALITPRNQLFGKKPRAPRVAPDTRREILRGHPPPKKASGSKVVHMSKEQKRPNVLRKFFNKKYEKNEFDEMERTPPSLVEDMPYNVPIASKNVPPPSTVQEQAMSKLREETTHDLPTMNIDKDGGYGTATSDENKYNHSFEDDQFSIEDISQPVNEPPAWKAIDRSSPKEARKSMMEEAAETFKGRAPIPPITDTPVSMDDKGEKLYSDEKRRKLKGTVSTYIPTTRGGRLS